jgi:hypothetical protein
MESKNAIEIMTSRGYKNTASGANGDTLFFLKKIDDSLDIHGTIYIKTESVFIDIIGALDMGISIRSMQMALESQGQFEKTEDKLLTYISVLRGGVTEEPKPEPKIKTEPIPLETRKSEFWQRIRQAAKEKGFEREMCLRFYDKWTEKTQSGKRMRFETEKTFEVDKRLNTWKQNDKKWSKDFVDKKIDQQNKELEEVGTKVIKKKDLF